MSQFNVTIEAGALVRGNRHVPAEKIIRMYEDAVKAEMHPTVAAAVTIWTKIGSPAENKRAYVEVTIGRSVKHMGFGAVTNAAISYLFELKDAVETVIENYEPPESAWVVDEVKALPATGDATAMPEQTAPVATGTTKLNVDDHAHTIAKAMQASHFPDIAEIEAAAPTYINDAKAFIAAFNAALDIMGNLQRTIHPQQLAATQAEMQKAAGDAQGERTATQ